MLPLGQLSPPALRGAALYFPSVSSQRWVASAALA